MEIKKYSTSKGVEIVRETWMYKIMYTNGFINDYDHVIGFSGTSTDITTKCNDSMKTPMKLRISNFSKKSG